MKLQITIGIKCSILFQSIPSNDAMFVASSPYVWNYETEPLMNMGGMLKGKKMRIYHGKSLGGSSSLNFMHYVRGSSKDFDEWEQLGNPGWKFEDVLPYFIKAENNIIPDLHDSSKPSGKIS